MTAPNNHTSKPIHIMDDYDNALFGSIQEALANTALPITNRAKARMADTLTMEAMSFLRVELARVKGVPRVGGPARPPRPSRAKPKPAPQP
jgi:hypothetical protein